MLGRGDNSKRCIPILTVSPSKVNPSTEEWLSMISKVKPIKVGTLLTDWTINYLFFLQGNPFLGALKKI